MTGGMSHRHGVLFHLKIASVVLLILVLAAGGFLFYCLRMSPAAKQGAMTHTKSEDLTPAQALSAAQTELKAANTSPEKATAYDHLGEAYLQNQNTSQAISTYQSALAADKSASSQLQSLSGLVSAYDQAGQTHQEIATIEQLIVLLQQSNDAASQRAVHRYQDMVANLKEGS